METSEFETIVEGVSTKIHEVLVAKAKEYATEDRLHNFRRAAALKGETMEKTLFGIMVKHTVSITDMCMSEKAYPTALWDEKIIDHLNYLILLRAIVEETNGS